MESKPLWYFAYGSNLDPRTFVGRRRMRPLAARNVQLRDYRLVFDLPIGPGQRGVANLLPELGAIVRGVAYQISEGQARRLDRTEGVPSRHSRMYHRTATAAESLPSDTWGCCCVARATTNFRNTTSSIYGTSSWQSTNARRSKNCLARRVGRDRDASGSTPACDRCGGLTR